jgi:tRNA dimethylallyltransferase
LLNYHYRMLIAALCGATAVGKSAVALRLARANGFEILSADSRQIYRGLAVGTGAPTEAERAAVPHHLVGFADPAQAFSPRAYPPLAHALLEARPDARFLVVGGTGLYLKELFFPSPFDRGPTPEAVKAEVQARLRARGAPALHAELAAADPEAAAAVHPNDAYRIAKRWENLLMMGESYTSLSGPAIRDPRFADVPILWLDREREELYRRIDARVEAMMRSGWAEEARALAADPAWRTMPAFSSLGYAEMTEVAEGRLAPNAALESMRKRTRNYAKRQRTFFRGQLPGAIRWDCAAFEALCEAVEWRWEALAPRLESAPNGGESGI